MTMRLSYRRQGTRIPFWPMLPTIWPVTNVEPRTEKEESLSSVTFMSKLLVRNFESGSHDAMLQILHKESRCSAMLISRWAILLVYNVDLSELNALCNFRAYIPR